MNEKWIWLPDWASNLGVWEDDLADVQPSASHTYTPYDQMADYLEHPMDIPGLKKASTVVAWGLGALSLMCSSSTHPKGQKWILLSPYADFCDEIGHWTVPNLHFMAHQLQTTTEPALKAFMELFEEDFGDWQDDWFENAKKYNAESLSKGLLYLSSHRVESVVPGSRDILVLYGRMDTTVEPAWTLKLKEFLPEAEFKERPKAGHWPPMLLL
ncbi:MAG: alpha/beta hydrolase [Fibrobacter sp.]|nr:alpha/beta hydrolase [Fibrobacter sp.]